MTKTNEQLDAALIYMADAPWNRRPYEELGEAARYSKEIYEAARKWHDLMQAIERGEKAIVPREATVDMIEEAGRRKYMFQSGQNCLGCSLADNAWDDMVNAVGQDQQIRELNDD